MMLQMQKGASAPCQRRDGSARRVGACRQQQQRSSRRQIGIIPCAAAVASGPEAPSSIQTEPVFPVLPGPQETHFEANNTVFTEEFRIRGNEAGPDQRANIITIANLLQEIGGNHGVAMWGRSSTGFASMPGMDHLIFVATRMQIRMEAYPMWGDIVRLETYFAEDGRLTTRRDWRLVDAKTGRYLGAATSTWVTINTETRRPAKIPEDVKQRFRVLAPSPPRFAIAADQARKKLPEFVWPPQLTAPSQLGRRSDMDPNGHINNVAYLAWAMEVIPEETYQNYQLTEVEMDFKAECTAGDQIECFGMPLVDPADPDSKQQRFLHLLRKGGTETEVWRARTTWSPISYGSSNGRSSSNSVVVPPATNGRAISTPSSSLNGSIANGASKNGRSAAAAAAVPTASSNGAAASNGKAAASSSSSSNGTASSSSSTDSSTGSGGVVGAALGAVAALFSKVTGDNSNGSKS